MFTRKLEKKLRQSVAKSPVVAVLGPRQSGKTTLVKKVFPDYAYTNLENLNQRELAQSDPSFFLKSYKGDRKLIIDEVQHAPELLSYIQLEVDEKGKVGEFILIGSQNLLMSEQIAQTLAGRVSIFDLLPLSMEELKQADALPQEINEVLFKGGYPRVYVQNLSPADWYSNYIRTYLEKDVRQMKNIPNLSTFQRFLKLCAGRIGQVINFSDLGRDCGISYHTAQSWMSILEASFIVFLLQPYYKNFSKRVVKAPKLYFYDTGLACSLLQLESSEQIAHHYLRGSLFESYVISDLLKQRFNAGKRPNCYFWRDHKGHEVDCILDLGDHVSAVEIKSAETIASNFFSGLRYWCQLSDSDTSESYLVYGGAENQVRREAKVLSWLSLSDMQHLASSSSTAPSQEE